MVSILISLLFLFAAILALGVLVENWRVYGTHALALRSQLRETPEICELRYRIFALGEAMPPPPSAVILRPQFRIRQPQLGLRAAA